MEGREERERRKRNPDLLAEGGETIGGDVIGHFWTPEIVWI